MAAKFYAVKKGRTIGIFNSGDECKLQISGFAGAQYKSFTTKEEAQNYLDNNLKIKINKNDNYEAIAYTDGSFKAEINQFSYGLVFLNQNKKSVFCEKFDDENGVKLRNVAGEIMGAQKAMQLAFDNKLKLILICHDYAGISKGCTGEWKTTKRETKSYKAFYDKMTKDVVIHFKGVKGHSGDTYNDEADALAGKAFTLKKISKPIV